MFPYDLFLDQPIYIYMCVCVCVCVCVCFTCVRVGGMQTGFITS